MDMVSTDSEAVEALGFCSTSGSAIPVVLGFLRRWLGLSKPSQQKFVRQLTRPFISSSGPVHPVEQDPPGVHHDLFDQATPAVGEPDKGRVRRGQNTVRRLRCPPPRPLHPFAGFRHSSGELVPQGHRSLLPRRRVSVTRCGDKDGACSSTCVVGGLQFVYRRFQSFYAGLELQGPGTRSNAGTSAGSRRTILSRPLGTSSSSNLHKKHARWGDQKESLAHVIVKRPVPYASPLPF
jgi:hypothetical protein